MIKGEKDYSKCTDPRKEIHWNVCKHLKKDKQYYCSLVSHNKKLCPAWEDVQDSS